MKRGLGESEIYSLVPNLQFGNEKIKNLILKILFILFLKNPRFIRVHLRLFKNKNPCHPCSSVAEVKPEFKK